MSKPWLTFDCYDTLVRYSEGKAAALATLVREKGGDDAAVASAQSAFEACEKQLQLGSFIILNAVLRKSLRAGLEAAELPVTTSDEETIIEAVKSSEPFPDTTPTLADLKREYRLAILSNSEPAIIRHNIASIGVEFDAVVLAAEAKCYKPDPGMFHELLKRIDEAPENVTHIAQSFYHDMRTSKDLGFGRRLWINRYGRDGDPDYTPDAELPDLTGVRAQLT
jgi:2-haloacid dehalogenase